MHLYTIDDPPMFVREMPIKKMRYFAYLYQKHGDKDMAIYILAQAKENIRISLNDKSLTTREREALNDDFYQVDENLDLLLQNKWVIKDKFTE